MNPPPPPPPPPPPRVGEQHIEPQSEGENYANASREEESFEVVGDEIQIEEDDEDDEPFRLDDDIQEQTQQKIQQPLAKRENQMAVIKIRSLMGEILQILVTSDMLQEELAHCIAHAALSPSEGRRLLESWSSDEGVTDWSKIAVSSRHQRCICYL